jgi:D-amino-acid dehydrogenase
MALRRGASAALAGLGGFTVYRYQAVKQQESQLPKQPLAVFPSVANDSRHSVKQQQQRQRVIIIGAGVVGVSTAYKLGKMGHQVVVLEPSSKPGEECSHCAAGGMSRQNVVVDKNTWVAVLKCLAPTPIRSLVFANNSSSSNLDKDHHFDFFHIDWVKSLSDPFFLRWALTFSTTSFFPPDGYNKKQQNMLRFTDFAVQDMVDMLENKWDSLGKKVGYNPRGSLAVSYENPSTKTISSKPPTHSPNNMEPNRQLEETAKVLMEEPSLSQQQIAPTSAKFEYDAKAASSGRFTKELARRCEADSSLNVSFVYNTKVQGVTTEPGQGCTRVSKLHTNKGVVEVPKDVHVVVAAGAWSPHILAMMDVYAPVYPLKGYAMSVSAKEVLKANPNLKDKDLPSRIVCDKYMYTTRLGDEIRITSIGEFSEWDTSPTSHVDDKFRAEAIRQFPQLQEAIQKAKTYCGHRPYVADGILLLGALETHSNLYVSCGPGSNGWKLATGSGEVIARLISGQTPKQIQDELGFDVKGFSPAGRAKYSPLFAKLCRARWFL